MRNKLIIPSLLLIAAMFVIAEQSGQREIIFPEIAALALGAWIMEKSPWKGRNLHFWISPTLAALTGMLMVRYFTYSPVPMITAAFCLVFLQLRLFRSGILPSISAAILAIITRSESWYYPLSVCILTGTIALGKYVSDRCVNGTIPGPVEEPVSKGNAEMRSEEGPAYWSKLLAGVTLVSAIASASGNIFMVAPPLIVAFVELSKPGGVAIGRVARALGLLVFAALSGVFWHATIKGALGWPLWLAASLAAATMLTAFHLIKQAFPPALAIALLPTILPAESLYSYPWQVLLGSSAFLALSRLPLPLGERVPAAEWSASE